MEKLIGEFVKVVFSDGYKNKAVKGILENIDSFNKIICVKQENGPAFIAIKNIVSMMPYEEEGNDKRD